ncbi:MAG: sugar ABC transporter substrate-binding protein [Anaerolineaceae bacterium]|nr:sugar ABC transporter substrate-binding protein [Anaerolineae bacterium]MCB9461118.1 sugar ABC transporter substrate-binding protein [Anaerolineaceae bacterium]
MKLLQRLLPVFLILCLVSTGIGVMAQDVVEIDFSIWAGCESSEGLAIQNAIDAYEADNPNVKVNLICIAGDGYQERISAMIASGTNPDMGYLNEAIALEWASEGALLDLTEYFQNDPVASARLPQSFYRYGDNQILGTNTAGEIMLLFYNKDNFDAAGLDYPPTNAADAWTWEEFVDVCQQLTIDRNGNNAASAEFDPENIDTYGCNTGTWWAAYHPLLVSNGADIFSEDGMQVVLNSPEAQEVFQSIYDLMYVYHVMPSPAAFQARQDVGLQTGKLAMQIDGHWTTSSLADTEGLNFGIGVLPRFDEPVTTFLGGVTVIFANTEHPNEVFEFYTYHNDPEYVPMYSDGLWMPLTEEYYTDPVKRDEWLHGQEGVYPEGVEDSIVDYTLNYAVQAPIYWVKNWPQIMDEAIGPAIEAIFADEMSVADGLNQAVEMGNALTEGRWVNP